MTVIAAVVQLTTTSDSEASLQNAEHWVRRAAQQGAQLIALPENTSFMGDEAEKIQRAEPLDGPTFQRMGDLARELQVWLIAGTLPERSPDASRCFNTSTVFGPDGSRLAAYRKMHLFDVQLGGRDTLTESRSTAPGDTAVAVDLPFGTLGLSVCYDLRFARLYQTLSEVGAQIISVPAAFTVPTGMAHWEVLLRARAIENLCFVLAPAQVGKNTPTRQTYGHAMIIDPWGTILAQAPEGPGIALAELDFVRQSTFRERLPCLNHVRKTPYPVEHILR
jgi:deaminated glutathione amidase